MPGEMGGTMKTMITPILVLAASAAFAQPAPQPTANPLATYLKTAETTIQTNIAKSADKLAEADFAFRPAGIAPEVRTFGQFLGHIANSSYFFCARAKGEPSPSKVDIEKTVTAKADLVKALQDAFAYCDTVYGGMTDAQLLEPMSVPGPNNTTRQVTRAQVLIANLAHNNEHYGNLVTYLRAKGIVPPSSERTQ
jgi:uncharacterized damage-inducible protein DinB